MLNIEETKRRETPGRRMIKKRNTKKKITRKGREREVMIDIEGWEKSGTWVKKYRVEECKERDNKTKRK